MSFERVDLGEDVTLYRGDCLEVMQTLEAGSVDVTITSPPYNLIKEWTGGGPNSNVDKDIYDEWYEDEMDEEVYQEWQKTVIRECLNLTKGSIFYNHIVRYAFKRRNTYYHPMHWLSDFPVWCEIIWDKGGRQASNTRRFTIADERIYMIGKPIIWNNPKGTNVWRLQPDKNENGHPCTFPISLPLRCLHAASNYKSVAFDPFMGSGTTGVAAVQLGRRFIGIEIDPGYFETAVRRIKEAQLQIRMDI